MQSKIVSDYLINEFFLIHKNYTKVQLQTEFKKFTKSFFNYQFNNFDLLFQAFTHKSFAHEAKIDLLNNEKLEFLGDSVVQLAISQQLFKKFVGLNEGSLSKLRSAIVNESTLAKIGRFYHLSDYMLVGKGELKNKGHLKDSLISNTFEALIGAIYLDSDFNTSEKVLLALIEKFEQNNKPILDQSMIIDFDAKSRLQEVVMEKYKTHPQYESETLSQDEFKITLKIKDQEIDSIIHYSKKKAMQLLAKKVLETNLLNEINL